MNAAEIENQIARHSADTGIPARELKQLCIRHGLEALESGGLKIRAADAGTLPVYLPRGLVELLRAIIEGTANCRGGIEDYIAETLGNELKDSLENPKGSGLICMLPDFYDFGSDKKEIVTGMESEISQWHVIDGKFKRKEGDSQW